MRSLILWAISQITFKQDFKITPWTSNLLFASSWKSFVLWFCDTQIWIRYEIFNIYRPTKCGIGLWIDYSDTSSNIHLLQFSSLQVCSLSANMERPIYNTTHACFIKAASTSCFCFFSLLLTGKILITSYFFQTATATSLYITIGNIKKISIRETLYSRI